MAEDITLSDLAAALGVSTWSVWNAARKGRIPASQPLGKGTTWHVDPDFLAKSERRSENTDSTE